MDIFVSLHRDLVVPGTVINWRINLNNDRILVVGRQTLPIAIPVSVSIYSIYHPLQLHFEELSCRI